MNHETNGLIFDVAAVDGLIIVIPTPETLADASVEADLVDTATEEWLVSHWPSDEVVSGWVGAKVTYFDRAGLETLYRPIERPTTAERAAEADRANLILAVEDRIAKLRAEVRAIADRGGRYNSDAEAELANRRARTVREIELPAAVLRLEELQAGIGSGLRP